MASAAERFAKLRAERLAVLPSLLLCDFGNLEREIRRLENGGAQALHLDVMDGRFVPNLTYGMPIVAAIRKLTDLPLDVHLMIDEPEQYVSQFVDAGADLLTVHVEAVADVPACLQKIKDFGVGAGIALNPPTPWESIRDCLPTCDLVLVMSVMPGFGGQRFDSSTLGKLQSIREVAPSDVLLEIDGGVNRDTIAGCADYGATYFVAGSAIFGQEDYGRGISELTEIAESRL